MYITALNYLTTVAHYRNGIAHYNNRVARDKEKTASSLSLDSHIILIGLLIA